MFACASGICIGKEMACDGWNDCGDMSDEMDCSKFTFDPNVFISLLFFWFTIYHCQGWLKKIKFDICPSTMQKLEANVDYK